VYNRRVDVRDHFVENPPSADIAVRLNQARADVCEHQRSPCILRCGVAFNYSTLAWQVIPADRRRRWLENMEANAAGLPPPHPPTWKE
jgi:hypothetical protein